MATLPIEWTTDVDEGAHRLRLRGQGTPAAWAAAIECMNQRLMDQYYWSAWDTDGRLDLIAAEAVDDGAIVYLAGSTSMYRALSLLNASPPPVDAAALSLAASGGRLDQVTWESKPLESAGYDRITTGNYPWPIRFTENEVRTVRPVGAISPAQLDVLTAALGPAVRNAAMEPLSPNEPAAVVVDDGVRLTQTVPAGLALELIFVWWQLCWVDLTRVELLGDGRPPKDLIILNMTWRRQ